MRGELGAVEWLNPFVAINLGTGDGPQKRWHSPFLQYFLWRFRYGQQAIFRDDSGMRAMQNEDENSRCVASCCHVGTQRNDSVPSVQSFFQDTSS
jgi:hypothetical protein